MHSSIFFRCLHLKTHLYSPSDYFSINDLLIVGLFSNTSLATECSTPVCCLNKVLKISNGHILTSHRPTWWRDSPISQSLRAECPKYGCMGGLAPGPNH